MSAAAASYRPQGTTGGPLLSANRALLVGMAFTLPWGIGILVFTGANLPMALVLFAVPLEAIRWLHRWPRGHWGRCEWAVTLLVLWAVLSNAWTLSPPATVKWSYYYAVDLAAFILVRRTIRSRRDWVLIGNAYLSGCLLAVGLLLVQWQEGMAGIGSRYAVAGVNANHTAYALATAFPVAAALSFSKGQPSWRRLTALSAVAVALVVGIMLTGCRSAALAVLVGLLVVYARVLLARPARGALLLLLGAALIWQFYLRLPDGLKARLRTAAAQPYTASAGDDLSGRLEVWPIAMRLFTDHPLMGIGAGAFTDENPEGIATHNVFLGVAAELGLIGLLLYLAAVWYAVRGPLATGPGQWPCWAALALVSVWLVIGLAGVWEVSLVAWYSFAWLSVIPAVHALPARASTHRRRAVPVAARALAPAASLLPVVN